MRAWPGSHLLGHSILLKCVSRIAGGASSVPDGESKIVFDGGTGRAGHENAFLTVRDLRLSRFNEIEADVLLN